MSKNAPILGPYVHFTAAELFNEVRMRQLRAPPMPRSGSASEREAARRGQTMSELVESALRQALGRAKPVAKLPPLPSFSSGGSRIDISNRNALPDAMGR
ncbi:hypothetical protein EBR56_05175 [bacterium]|nr:hypothetical protein [bacterium]